MSSKYKIGELCKFFRGASVPRVRMHESGDYLYVHYGDLYKGFNIYIDVEDKQKPLPAIASSENIKDEQFLVNQDILYVLTSETVNDLGHAFLFKDPRNVPAVAGTETTIMRVSRRDLVLPAYLNYMTQTVRFKRLLRQYVKGMKVFRVHPTDVARIEVDLPNLEDQGKVVHILDNIEAKILLNQRTNDYLLELADAIFKERFIGEDALCSTAKALMKEIAQINAGGDRPAVYQQSPSEECPVPIYSNGMDNEGLYGYTNVAKITEPSVTVSARGTIGFTCLRHQPYYPIVRLISATPKNLVTAEYLFLWLRNTAVTGVGTTQQQLTVPMFKNYEVNVPSAGDLDAFTKVATPLFAAIDANKNEISKLSELRYALLPKLMSGEIDASRVVI